MFHTVRPPTRLAIVLSHPTQYYSPWFRWLTANTRLQLRVFYLWDFGVTAGHDANFQQTFKWDVDLLGGYESEFVPNTSRAPGPDRFWGFNNPQLTKRLDQWRPDALLIFGYKYASHLRAIAWARKRRIPLLFRGDSHLLGRARPRGLRTFALRRLYSQFAAITYVGAANRAYFQALGVPDERLFFAPHSVDDRLFAAGHAKHIAAAAALRSGLGLSANTRVVLFAGKFVAAKQPRALLDAFISLRQPNTALLFVGGGPERDALVEGARAAPASAVHFLPFANQTEMPSRYAAADVFALPSHGTYETWGLAVNEAMHMGLPCLVSNRVGCQSDLVTDGETGWVFEADDTRQLQARLAAALTDDLGPYRERVASRIAGYTYRETSAGLIRALGSLAAPGDRMTS
ncbi:MAG: glycosyltransferase family 4 protein [Opitutaceae bacterium]|nr:glycosyltransferase family 4 protein [Opitutaceae bacterium]